MSQGYLSLVLHAHLPFVRHPEHERFLEENWLYEAVVETYIPLLQVMEGWQRDKMDVRITLTLTPSLCAMLRDPLLQDRCARYLRELVELSEKEVHRTYWDKPFHEVALMYHRRFIEMRDYYQSCGHNLLKVFRRLQDDDRIEIITSAATHALLPLVASHKSSLRAQVLTARDHYRDCFGRDPRGIWLPECAYVEGVEGVLQEANIRWFIVDTHGLLHAHPRPRYGVFAPVYTPNGLAVFGRDLDSARQVWSRHEGYPGDFRYRDFYRDVGFDLDLDYIKPYLAVPDKRSFIGIKYHRITGATPNKDVYNRQQALQAAAEHAGHFLNARLGQINRLTGILDRPPLLVSPYDAELFGHWWYEGPEFLDYFVRKTYFDQHTIKLITPEQYLQLHPTNQVATPSASSWGEEGYWRTWLNENNQWIYPHLQVAQARMEELVARFKKPSKLTERALKQAARELLLAQSSDWPFILRTGTSPDYARRRVKDHLLRFITLYEQLTQSRVDEKWLREMEKCDNIFPDVNYKYWA